MPIADDDEYGVFTPGGDYGGICFGVFDDTVVALHGRSQYSLFASGLPPANVNDEIQGPYFYPVQVGNALYAVSGQRRGWLSRFNLNRGRLHQTSESHLADDVVALAVQGDLLLALEIRSLGMEGVPWQVSAYRDGKREGSVPIVHAGKTLDASADSFASLYYDADTEEESVVVYHGGTVEEWTAAQTRF